MGGFRMGGFEAVGWEATTGNLIVVVGKNGTTLSLI